MVAESSQGTGFLLERPSACSTTSPSIAEDFGEGRRLRQRVNAKTSALNFNPFALYSAFGPGGDAGAIHSQKGS